MAGVNRAIILGHLGRDPEMRYMPDGKAVANLAIATSETYKDKDGNKVENTEWHRVALFGRIAEVAGEYLKKGSMAYIEGKLQTRKWTDKEGQERYTTEIIGDRLQLVGGRSGGTGGEHDGAGASSGSASSAAPARSGGGGGHAAPMDFEDDEIPFAVPFDVPSRPRVRF